MKTLFREPTNPEMRFIGAVRELVWSAALVDMEEPVPLAEAVLCPELIEALVAMILEAPNEVLEIMRTRLKGTTPIGERTGLELRNLLLENLSQACLGVTDALVREERTGDAGRFFAAAIRLLPARTARQEQGLGLALDSLATRIGALEAPVAEACPELEEDPLSDFQLSEGFDAGAEVCRALQPYLLPEMIRLAAEQGASDEFLVGALLLVFQKTHWPTWRAISRMRGDFIEFLPKVEARLQDGGLRPPPGACRHLQAIVDDWDIKMPPLGDIPF